MPGPLSGPPLYHYHKSPECLAPFRNASLGFHHGAQPYQHAQLMGDLHWTPFLSTYFVNRTSICKLRIEVKLYLSGRAEISQ